jgi:membrane protease YdiL (CAAX protease family)
MNLIFSKCLVICSKLGFQPGTNQKRGGLMQSIKSKKFFLDYLIGSSLIVAALFVLIGNITIMDTRGTLTLVKACGSPGSSREIVRLAQEVLRGDEFCKLELPCNQLQSLRCEGTARVLDIFKQIFAQDLLIIRVKMHLTEQYRFGGYSDRTSFRVPTSLMVLFFTYFLLLVEAGALIFALWRQNLLISTFSFPIERMKKMVLASLFWGTLMAVFVIAGSNLLNLVVEYSPDESRKEMLGYFKTIAGIVLAVLIAPFIEELVFRGVILKIFIERNKQTTGIILVSVLFSALHGFQEAMGVWQFFFSSAYFIISIGFCNLYIKEKSFWAPIICHSAYNTISILYFNLMS